MDITIEEIQKKFDSLPEDMKWVIMQTDVDGKVTEMGKSFGLTVSQMGQLSLEINMVMLGFTHPDTFERALKENMNMPEDKAKDLAKEINEKIFKEIRDSLMTLYVKDENKIPVSDKINTNTSTEEEIESREEILKTIEGSVSMPTIKKEISTTPVMPTAVSNPAQNVPRKTEAEMRSMLAQKLSGSFQMPKVTTTHSARNSEGSVKKDLYREPVE